VRAGYVDIVTGKKELVSPVGVPQGGTLSPILSNIYLHELDKFVEGLRRAEEAKGIPYSIDIPGYKNIHTVISNKRLIEKKTKDGELRNKLLKEIKSLEKVRASKPSKNTNYKTYQIWYVRYADDFIIGIRGKKEKVQEVFSLVKEFLSKELLLNMSDDKSLITNVKNSRANFLGAEIRALTSRTHDATRSTRNYIGGRRRVRVSSGKMILLAPLEKLVKKLADQGICRVKNFANRDIIPQKKSA